MAADYLSFPKFLAAATTLFTPCDSRDHVLHGHTASTQQRHDSSTQGSLFSPWVSVSELVFTESKPVLSREAECLGLVRLGVRGLRCPFCWAGTAGT